MIVYTINKSSSSDIYNHLINVDNSFAEPLSRRLDIGKYADKLYTYAQRVEAWCEGEMVGLVAYYRNDAEHFYHVSNVSIEAKFQHKGIAHKLLSQVFDSAKLRDMKKINLVAHKLMIPFYEKFGFTIGRQIDSEHHEMDKYLDEDDVLVSVCCLTYNHEKYLRDCLNGIVSQKTNFKYEILIHDDASTDKTTEIIKEYEAKYPLIKPIYQKINQFSQGIQISEKYQFSRAKGKYIAICEGDDYWTDPLKLQKQVDFLEKHPEYDMVCARFDRLIYETGENTHTDLYDNVMPNGVDGMEILQEHFVQFVQPHPCTVMVRNGMLYNHPVISKLKYKFDIPLYYVFLYNHRVWLMAEKMAIYRKHQESITQRGENELWSLSLSHRELLDYFPDDPNLKRMVGCDVRKEIIIKSRKESFKFKDFWCLLKEYTKYNPTRRNVLTLIVRVIQQNLRKRLKVKF